MTRELTPSEEARATHTPEGTLVCSDEVRCRISPLLLTRVQEYAIEMNYLKSKVDAGAHVITTQMFFEAELFAQFVRDCRAAGITVPIIPGIMLLQARAPPALPRLTPRSRTTASSA